MTSPDIDSGLVSKLKIVMTDLEGDNITKRRKAQDDLTLLLENSKLWQYLAQPSTNKLGWNNVYNSVHCFLMKEAVKLEKDESAGRRSNLAITAAKSMHLVKLVVKCANRGGNHLKIGHVVDSLMDLMNIRQGKFRRELFGSNAMRILHDLVVIPYYAQRLEEEKTGLERLKESRWRKLLLLTFELFSNPPQSLDFMALSEFWFDLMALSNDYSGVTLECLRSESTFSLIEDLLRSEKVKSFSADQKTSFLRGVNRFMDITFPDCREKLCTLGEKTLPDVLDMFDMLGSDRSWEGIFYFVQMQMSLHHPLNRRFQNEGAYFGDEHLWNRHLHRLYQNLVENIIFNLARKKHFKLVLPDQYIRVMSSICFQLLSRQSSHIDCDNESITQNIQRDQTQMGGAPKRLRIEVFTWDNLLSKLNVITLNKTEQDKQRQAIPWLNIIEETLRLTFNYYNGSSNHALVTSTLDVLMEALHDCKYTELKGFIFKCLEALLDCCPSSSMEKSKLKWMQASNMALNSACANHALKECHQLLKAIISNNILSAEVVPNLYCQFANRTLSCTEYSSETLLTILSQHDVPLKFKQSFSCTNSSGEELSGRETLLKWFWSEERLYLKDEMNVPIQTISPTLSAKLLWSLVIKNSPRKNILLCSDQSSHERRNPHFEEVERLILEYDLHYNNRDHKKTDPDEKEEETTVVTPLLTKVNDVLVSYCASVIHPLKLAHQDPNELMNKVWDGLAAFQLMSGFLKIGERLDKGFEILERLKLSSEEILAVCLSKITKLLADQMFSRKSKSKLARQLVSLADISLLTFSHGNEDLLQSLEKCFETEQKSYLKNTEKNVLDHLGEESYEDRETKFHDLDSTHLEESEDLLRHVLLLRTSICFSLLPKHGQMKNQEKLISVISKLLKEQSATNNKFLTNLAFDILERIAKSQQWSTDVLHDIFETLKNLPKKSIKESNFDPFYVSKILHVFSVFLPRLIEKKPDSQLGDITKVYIRVLTVLNEKTNFHLLSLKLILQIIEILGQLDASWNKSFHYKSAIKDEGVKSCFEDTDELRVSWSLCRYLCFPSERVRQSAGDAVVAMLSNFSRSSQDKKETYEKVLVHLNFMINTLNNLPSLMISAKILMKIGAENPFLMKLSVSKILLLKNMSTLPDAVVARVLKQLVDRTSGYDTTKSFLVSMLDHILSEFLKENLPHHFPWRLLNCSSEREFMTKFQHLIVPMLLWRRQDHEVVLHELAKRSGSTVLDILKSNYRFIVSFTLPVVAAFQMNRNDLLQDLETEKKKATKINDFLKKNLKERFDGLLLENISEILSLVFSKLYDPIAVTEYLEVDIDLITPYPPLWSEGLAQTLVDFLCSLTENRSSLRLLTYIAVTTTDGMEKLSVELCTGLRMEHVNKADHIRNLHGIYLAAKNLEKESVQLREQLPFVCWFIVNSVINLIEKTPFRDVKLASCHVLKAMVTLCVANPFSSITSLIIRIQSALATLPANDLKLQNLVSSIVQLFPVNDSTLLTTKMMNSDTSVEWTKENLKCVLQTFNQISDVVDANKLSTCLTNLFKALGQNTRQLAQLFETLTETQGLAEDAKTSVIHQLLARLMKLCSNSNEDLRIKVSRCLGQIGPCNLGTLSLKVEEEHVIVNANDKSSYMPQIVNKLFRNLASENNEEIKATSLALKTILSSRDKTRFNQTDFKDFDLLNPFLVDVQENLIASILSVDETSFVDTDIDSLMCSADEVDYKDWMREVVTSLLTTLGNSRYRCLSEVCKLRTDFCEILFPILIHEILSSSSDLIKTRIGKTFDNFFRLHFESLLETKNTSSFCANSPTSSEDSRRPYANLECLRAMLSVVSHLRHQPMMGSTVWNQNFWLPQLNYLHVAKAAMSCSNFFSTIIFIDIWTQQQRNKPNVGKITSSTMSESLLNVIHKLKPEKGAWAQQMLFECYQKLGEHDALYGCGTNTLLRDETRVKYFVEEQKYFKAMQFLDKRNGNGNTRKREMNEIMYESGLLNSMRQFVRNSSWQQDEKLSDYQFNCLWRLEQWEEDFSQLPAPKTFHGFHCTALKKFVEEDFGSVAYNIERAQNSSCLNIATLGRESARPIYEDLSQLRLLQELETFLKLGINKESEFQSTLDKLREYDSVPKINFGFTEPIHLQRTILTNSLKLGNKSLEMSIAYAKDCCLSNKLQMARNRLKSLEMTSVVSEQLGCQIKYQESLLLWKSDEKKLAVLMLSDLAQRITDQEVLQNSSINGELHHTLGQWSAEMKSLNANTILENYFQKAINIFDEVGVVGNQLSEAYLSLAKFCDVQYQHIESYLTSREFEEQQLITAKISKDSARLKDLGTCKEVRQGAFIMQRHAKLGEVEIETSTDERAKYLSLAIENYGRVLTLEKDDGNTISRFVSLWFKNHDNPRISCKVEYVLKEIDSSKLIPLMYQLAARLSETEGENRDSFQMLLTSVIERCGRDHPFHTLPVLLALINAYEDENEAFKQPGDSARRSGKQCQKKRLDKRGEAAKIIVKKIENVSTDLKNIVMNMTKLSLALVNLAYTEAGKSNRLSSSHEICKVRNYHNIPIATSELKIRVDKDYYSDIVGVKNYEPVYDSVGGINAPKKIYCVGTDGIKRPQLVKGKDDLRQDAVMQQVFGLMNSLLSKKESIRRKKLRIRQYKVVPLSQRSGVLEWCQGTLPISEFLIGSGKKNIGAHARYHPKDWTHNECRNKLALLQKNKIKAQRTKQFEELCQNINPVMRFFFFESFLSPAMYFERQLAYTRSVATSSMIGYILGLGDRHVHNILVDKKTAELIHIDLGVAFEQGKILPTPELVPFRLTRDIVDGFGPSGVEGNFRRCCEATLKVLRENKDEIMTILEVLTHDPLYNWSMTPDKAFRMMGKEPTKAQKEEWANENERSGDRDIESTGNKMAERILRRVAQKLDGVEDGHNMSLEGQVNTLVQQARDPARLCSIFAGWQPYL